MKLLISTIRICCLLVLTLLMTRQAMAQLISSPIPTQLPPAIVLAPGNNTASCTLNGANMTISVPKEALTGDNIPLNIQVPGSFGANCQTRVTITASPELQFVTSEAVPVQPVGSNTFTTVTPLPGNESRNFNVYFKFPPFVTCNGVEGELTVRVEGDCNGNTVACEQTVRVRARADNYWTVYQEFVSGDMVCGLSRWRVHLRHNNPNPTGLGTYRIDGAFTADPNLEVVSITGQNMNFHNVNILTWNPGQVYLWCDILVRNCAPEGSTITNNVGVDLVLGDGGTGSCATMQGTLTLTSPPMVSPNASISFKKEISGNLNNMNLSPGCDGRYVISVTNNGNVAWTNFEITDALPPGLSLNNNIFGGAINSPPGWTATVSGNTITVTGTNVVLEPGQSASIYIAFTIDPAVSPGTVITNTANLAYQAVGNNGGGSSGGGNTSTACPNVTCPELNTSVQNTTASVPFTVEEPRAIPMVKKCILDPPNAFNPPLYNVGNIIRFQIKVGNQGSGPLTTVLNDALGASANQNLQIIPGSISYAYYIGASSSVTSPNYCSDDYGVAPEPSIPPGLVTANTSDLQNPSFAITNLPGNCAYTKMNVLVITFDAQILPQLYGGKVNKAILATPGALSNPQSSVAYTIDEDGGLFVTKRADQDLVENGQSFNYIIELTNGGTVPLNNLTMTDALPGCVQRAGDITVRDALGNIIAGSTLTGNIQLALPAAQQLGPGETFTVTIPVQKVSGANCCNVTVYATGRMVTSNALQESYFGSELEPAACVRSTECCDVQGFEAQLVQQNGRYYLHITGGAVPLQEVDVTMLDFHVEYSSPDCKPANMGVFGQLSTTTNTLGGLLLSNGIMPAGSLSWGLGTPSVINGNAIELEITNPAILDIPCCEFELTFCIKVRVKDVNCNVCEKTICYTSEPTEPPCDLAGLELTSPGRICPGQTISFTWSGSSPSGGVEIYLVNAANPNNYHVIATGVSNGINSYTYTLPADFPCEGNQQWYIVIKDPKSDCMISSKRFTITCCEPRCDCGRWLSRDVKITQVIAADNGHIQFERGDNLLKRAANINMGIITRCGEKTTLNKGSYVLTAPNFGCTPESCLPTYRWEVQRVGDSQTTIGMGNSFPYQFVQDGIYNIKIIPICGGRECEPCQIQIRVGRIIGTVHPDIAIDRDVRGL